ncbi:hypothetical protein L1286_09075 [Pseudoalteromonas sp. SMS1]|uniref:hypothetical protein n=1 Tax=Pseudoalteromonas sp. SMS1 TaxID=2908894 RepID=UPI001F1FC46F|nr:hypothetical protein [Pseudoalteromonas sp. SMS1]MCF2857621.1 hypothetical protein [Pseudoalteromonas sp. SMS1]
MKPKYNGLFLATLTALHLTGCGGSSGNSAPITEERPDPAPIVFSHLSIKAMEQNKCGNLPVMANVVFHQDNGTFISSQMTQVDGTLESDIPTNAQHVSFVYSSETGTGEKFLQVQTVLNIQHGFEADAIVFKNYDTCGCNTIDYDLETLRAQVPDAHLYGASVDPIVLNTAPDSVSLCTDEQQQLLYTRFEETRKGAILDTSTPSTITLSDAQFMAQGTVLDFGDHTFEPRELITLSSYFGNAMVYNEHVNETRYNHTSYQDDNRLLIFKDLDTISYLSTTRLEEATAFGVSVSTNSYAINKVNEEGQVVGAPHIINDAALTHGYQTLAESLANESSTDVAVINFSEADHRINAVTLTLNWKDAQQGTAQWQFITDGNDTIPDLNFGDIIPQDKVTPLNVSMDVTLLALNTELEFDVLREVMIEVQESFEKRVESQLYDGAAIFTITAKPL